jgi:hypothetical protein
VGLAGPSRWRAGAGGGRHGDVRRVRRWGAPCSVGVKRRIGLDLALGLLGPELAWSDSVAASAAPVLGVTVDGLEVSLAPAGL